MLNYIQRAILSMAALPAIVYAGAEPIEPPMVAIPGGYLAMGANSDNPESDAHRVKVAPFRLGKYEVTVAEFKQFVEDTGYSLADTCNQMASKKWFAETPGNWKKHNHSYSEFEPVTCIGWTAMNAYAQWLATKTGKAYRLVGDAEWEYAVKAGSNHDYYWGDEPSDSCLFANVADQAAEAAVKRDYDGLESKDIVGVVPCNDNAGYAKIVGMLEPNAYGLYDMVGNINEFTLDCYNEDVTTVPADGSPQLVGDCSNRVIRGGSWHWAPFKSTARHGWSVDFVGALEGFRLAQDIPNDDACSDPVSEQCQNMNNSSDFEQRLAIAQDAERRRQRELALD